MAAETELTGIFNAGSGTGLTLVELARMIEKVSGMKLNIQYKAGRSFDVREIVLNIEKAKNLLNWEPEIAIQDGLSLLFNWMTKKHEISAE